MASGKGGDRTTKLTLQAENLTGKPFAEVSAAVDKLSEKLAQQTAAAKTGDATTRELSGTLGKLAQAQAVLASQSNLVDRYRQLGQAFAEASQKAAVTGAALQELAAKQGTAEAKSKDYARAVRQATAADNGAQRALNKSKQTFLDVGAAIERAGFSLEDLEGAQVALAAENAKLNASYVQGREVLENYDAIQRQLRATQQAAAQAAREQAAAIKAANDAQARADREAAEAQEELTNRFTKTISQRVAAASAAAEKQATFAKNLTATIQKADNDREKAQAAQAASEAAAAQKAAEAKAKAVADAQEAAEAKRLATFKRMLADRVTAASQAAQKEADFKNRLTNAVQKEDNAAQKTMAEAEARKQLNREIAESIKIREADAEASRKSAEQFKQSQASQAGAGASKPRAAGGGAAEGEAGQAGGSAFGLNPYQLQLLGYRLKDIVDQLGAGSSAARVFAQQGAATADIFQNDLIPAIVSFLPEIAAAAAVIGTLGLAFARLVQGEGSLRQFTAQLSVSADASRFNANQLVAQQREIEKLGASFADAGKALHIFMQAGTDQSSFVKMAAMAENLVHVYGGELPEAAKLVSQAYSGNFQALEKLNGITHAFTATQMETARSTGDFSKLMGELTGKLESARAIADGPLSKAFLDLSNSAKSFLDTLGQTGIIQRFLSDLRGIVKAADDFLRIGMAIGKLGQGGGTDSKAQEEDLKSQIKDLEKQQKGIDTSHGAGVKSYKVLGDQIEALTKQLDGLHAARMREMQDSQQASGVNAPASAPVQGKQGDARTEEEKAAGADYLKMAELRYQAEVKNNTQAKLTLAYLEAYRNALDQTDKEGNKLLTTEQAVGLAQQARAAKAAEIGIEERRREEGLERELSSMIEKTDKGFKDSLQSRLDAVDQAYAAIYPKLKDLEARGDKQIDGTPIAKYKEELEAQKEQAKQLATMQYYTEALAELEKERSDAIKVINTDVATGNKTALQGYNEAKAVVDKIAPQMRAIANDAVKFGQGLAKAHPGPQADSFLSSAQGYQKAGQGSDSGAGEKENQTLSNSALKQANDIVAERKALEQSLQELVEKRVLTEAQAESQLKSAYASTSSELQNAIKQVQAFISAMRAAGQGGIGLDKIDADLKKIQADAGYVSKTMQEFYKGVDDAFKGAVGNAFEGLTKNLGSLVHGTENLSMALRNAGLGALQFAQQFVSAIAQIIIKKEAQVAIDLILKSLGDFGLGFGGGGGGISTSAGASVGVSHGGSIIGYKDSPVMRNINPAIFANAPRYHSGSVVGLQPNEQAAILQKGEEVLSKSDPRNALNGGMRGDNAPAMNVRHVLVMDPEVVPQAMRGTKGEQVTMSHIKANLPTIRSLLNVSTRRN